MAGEEVVIKPKLELLGLTWVRGVGGERRRGEREGRGEGRLINYVNIAAERGTHRDQDSIRHRMADESPSLDFRPSMLLCEQNN